ncbi:energy-dependent translational throttle protein EttA [Psychrobacter sanguinis]|jgi:energy-dependent translational throttle protein EttA|uniref:energy-dependent translational throttle protein EttA n=1 Tax=Psychrobacter sanguinis TaxID=861445 RepID=UPI00020C82B8|nr:energy-dependent translational throttle protein EttA [Psychrobacter sanguinis]EGK07279.1 ABC superfamily ATP binding cassette transporter, ABC protein [Psychrobacter sp. 1501(2011)]MCC3309236.1 energy-dependent translational throttle protein EttA [Psychrobacter sanguinis]MCC3345545.1 energy-dependent translational throttle protein EttA [Psychrobacter sanguinis]MCD9151938.1 energy-dependent translational throttle protein EttA [Psychrobacter sanguinis]MDY3307498.1 energy-dependent translation
MAHYIYTMNKVSKLVPPKREILKDISLSFFPGAKIGVLGINGAGKSTLLRIMAGVDTDYSGEARAQPGTKIGYLPQEPQLDDSKDVRGNVEDGMREALDALARLDEIYAEYAAPDADFDKLAEEQGKMEDIIQAWDAHNLNTQLEKAADALRLPPWDAEVSKLSGGEKRRVALCRLLLSRPDMLLLDEPTNHLDAESVAWLEQFLKNFSGTIVAITHDRYFLDNVAEWILELDRGYGYPYEGNYTEWLEQKNKRLEEQNKQEESFAKALKKELEWVRKNQKGQQAKSKSRIQRFEELNSKEFQQRNETSEIYIPPGPRLGNKVIEVNNISKSFGDRLLYENLSFNVPPAAIVGIIGPNGAGKTTLFNMMTGLDKPDTGTVELGESVKVAYVGQVRDNLDDSKTVWEEVSDGLDIIKVGDYETPSRAYIGRFNFKGQDQQKLVGNLSGGERNRLQLAKTLKQGANVILLDEPSNDLDVETLRALEDAIQVFPGTVLVVSHDRWFLDRIATHILAFEPEGPVWYDGNYSEYEAYRKKTLGDDAGPKRMKYKKISS